MKDFETNEPTWIHEEEAGTTPVSDKAKKWITGAMVAAVPFCMWAGWFEWGRAHEGNWRAWVYTFEWPFFAGVAIYLWRRLMRGDVPKIPRPDLVALAREADQLMKSKPDHASDADGDHSNNK
ncbi:MAG TPA: hypothetical protein VMW30_09345 [Candidatus Paceibacterota bacterium]|nr:hypothetical protein [Candidatus Paceibacterota bacterium]